MKLTELREEIAVELEALEAVVNELPVLQSAEHDPWDIQLLRLYAERIGFQVVQVFQTQDVLPVAKQVRPDVIVLDSELPGTLSSLETMHELGTDPDIGSAAVLLFSPFARPNVERTPSEIQVYLQKPATYGTFLEALTKAGIQE